METNHAHPMAMQAHAQSGVVARTLLIGLIAFLTVIDLFGTQAILPALTRAYGVTPAAMGLALNAATNGQGARRQRRHYGHGGRRAHGRVFQPPHRPPPRHPREPHAPRGADRAPRFG